MSLRCCRRWVRVSTRRRRVEMLQLSRWLGCTKVARLAEPNGKRGHARLRGDSRVDMLRDATVHCQRRCIAFRMWCKAHQVGRYAGQLAPCTRLPSEVFLGLRYGRSSVLPALISNCTYLIPCESSRVFLNSWNRQRLWTSHDGTHGCGFQLKDSYSTFGTYDKVQHRKKLKFIQRRDADTVYNRTRSPSLHQYATRLNITAGRARHKSTRTTKLRRLHRARDAMRSDPRVILCI